MKSLGQVRLFETPWTVACQAPPSMEFSRQGFWSGLPFPSPGDFPLPGIKPWSPALAVRFFTPEPPGKPHSFSRSALTKCHKLGGLKHHLLSGGQESKIKVLAGLCFLGLWWSEVKYYSCLTLCDLMDCGLPGPSVHGIFQARILKWVAISFSRGFSRSSDQTQVSHIAGRFFTVWATRNIEGLHVKIHF